MALMMAAVIPAAYGIYHAVRFRSRSGWAMGMTYALLIPISRVHCELKGNVPRAHGSTTGYEHLRVDFSVGAKL